MAKLHEVSAPQNTTKHLTLSGMLKPNQNNSKPQANPKGM